MDMAERHFEKIRKIRGVIRSANRILSPLNLRIERLSPANSLKHGLRRFVALQDINVIYDIGAHRGTWSLEMAKIFPNSADFHLFEPNAQHNSQMAKTGFSFYNVLLSQHNGLADFYSSGGTGDSVYRENTSHYSELRPTRTRTITLDSFVASQSLPQADLIKVDTQGSELDILYGAARVLQETKFLYLEVPIVNYNEGAPSFTDYVRFCAQRGFAPAGCYELHLEYGLLLQVDLLFVANRLVEERLGMSSAKWMKKMLHI